MNNRLERVEPPTPNGECGGIDKKHMHKGTMPAQRRYLSTTVYAEGLRYSLRWRNERGVYM